ncbi:MAG TPA: CAP domain-containing protein [Solirubrobacteraceae bacterium]
MNRCLTLLLAVAMTALTLLLPTTAGASSTRSKKGSVHVRHITIHHAPRKGSKHGRKHKRKHHTHKRAVHHAHKSRPATAADECPNANLTPSTSNLESVVAATLCLVNDERIRFGESALIEDARLAGAAVGHSRDMDAHDYFSHTSPSGQTLLMRIQASGFIPNANVGYTLGENIAWGTLWLGTPRAIVKAWMESPGHRANILNGSYRYTGIGIDSDLPSSMSGGQAGGMYTQDFGTIIS